MSTKFIRFLPEEDQLCSETLLRSLSYYLEGRFSPAPVPAIWQPAKYNMRESVNRSEMDIRRKTCTIRI
jgi:hypothetical protein